MKGKQTQLSERHILCFPDSFSIRKISAAGQSSILHLVEDPEHTRMSISPAEILDCLSAGSIGPFKRYVCLVDSIMQLIGTGHFQQYSKEGAREYFNEMSLVLQLVYDAELLQFKRLQ